MNLLEVNVNDFTKPKNGMTYLSWAHAWKEVLKIHPDATYKIVKNPETHMPYFKDDTGYFTFTEMTINGITREMWLPVMEFNNKAKLKNVTVTEINKTVMRCLTKNIAMFGLGLYIYAGEDLPEDEPKKPEKEKVVEQPKEPELTQEQKDAGAKKAYNNILKELDACSEAKEVDAVTTKHEKTIKAFEERYVEYFTDISAKCVEKKGE